MEIKHIQDCWTLIRHEKTIEGVKKVLEELPRWSGDWDLLPDMTERPEALAYLKGERGDFND